MKMKRDMSNITLRSQSEYQNINKLLKIKIQSEEFCLKILNSQSSLQLFNKKQQKSIT